MAAKKGKRSTSIRKVKSLPARNLKSKQARNVKGGVGGARKSTGHTG